MVSKISRALFTALVKGLVPPSGGGITNFLRADGTWAVPSGGGGAPVDAEYIVFALHPSLTAERLLTDSAHVIWVGGASQVQGFVVTGALDIFTAIQAGIVPASGGGVSNFLRADGAWAAPPGGTSAWTTIIKPGDEAVNNNTLQDDNALLFTMLANTIYHVRLRVFFSTGATPDFKYRVTNVGATITLVRRQITRFAGGATSATYPTIVVATAFDAADVPLAGTGAEGGIVEDIIIQVGAVGGTFQFQWAQNTTTPGTPAIVLGGSVLEYAHSP